MINVCISNPGLFSVADGADIAYCGGCQEWYGAFWKRLSGCGPTVVSSIVNYLTRKAGGDAASLAAFRTLMDDVWRYVTPSIRGIPTTTALVKGARAYIDAQHLPYRIDELCVAKSHQLRPAFDEICRFIGDALQADAPVAFLSLDKGAEPLLDSWHWTTILALQCDETLGVAQADIADEGKLLRADLRIWYDTSTLGGGFVRFMPED